MTPWRWALVVWSIAAVVLVASQGYGVLAVLVVWLIGLVVIGGVRAAVQR